METLLKFIHIFASLFLILVVLLQSGRGGGMGAALGGASGQIFGGRGAGNFLTRVTSGAAVVFFLTSLTLSMLSSRHRSVLVGQQAPATAAEADATDSSGDEQSPETEPEEDDGERSGKNSPPDSKDDDPEHVEGDVGVGQGSAAGAVGRTDAARPTKPAATPPGVPEPAPASGR